MQSGGSALHADGPGTLITIDPVMLPGLAVTGNVTLGANPLATLGIGTSESVSTTGNQLVATAVANQGFAQLTGPVVSLANAMVNGATDGPPDLITLTGPTSLAIPGPLLQLTSSTLDNTTDSTRSTGGSLLSVSQSLLKTFGTAVPLIQLDQSTVKTQAHAVKIDAALLAATAPLIKLVAGSTMTSNSDLVKLVQNARLTAHVPSDALIMLNASTLNVNGSLFNVAGGSSLNVTGNLVSLTNGSTLTLTNGALVSVSGGSAFNLTGSFGSFGTGTNAINLPTSDVFGGHAHTINTSLIPGYGVALGNGAASSQVTVGGSFTPFTGIGGTNTVTPGGIVLHVDDTSHVGLH